MRESLRIMGTFSRIIGSGGENFGIQTLIQHQLFLALSVMTTSVILPWKPDGLGYLTISLFKSVILSGMERGMHLLL